MKWNLTPPTSVICVSPSLHLYTAKYRTLQEFQLANLGLRKSLMPPVLMFLAWRAGRRVSDTVCHFRLVGFHVGPLRGEIPPAATTIPIPSRKHCNLSHAVPRVAFGPFIPLVLRHDPRRPIIGRSSEGSRHPALAGAFSAPPGAGRTVSGAAWRWLLGDGIAFRSGLSVVDRNE